MCGKTRYGLLIEKGIDVTVVGAKIDDPIDHGRRRPDTVADLESLSHIAAGAIQLV